MRYAGGALLKRLILSTREVFLVMQQCYRMRVHQILGVCCHGEDIKSFCSMNHYMLSRAWQESWDPLASMPACWLS